LFAHEFRKCPAVEFLHAAAHFNVNGAFGGRGGVNEDGGAGLGLHVEVFLAQRQRGGGASGQQHDGAEGGGGDRHAAQMFKRNHGLSSWNVGWEQRRRAAVRGWYRRRGQRQ